MVNLLYSPPGSAFIDLFENINELVSYDLRNLWEDYLSQKVSEHWGPLSDSTGHFPDFLKSFNDRNVKRVHTKTKGKIDGPFVDESFNIGNRVILYATASVPGTPFRKAVKKQ